MINPSACVPIPISSRDVDVQTGIALGTLRKRAIWGAVGLLLVVVATILVELLRWGIHQLTAGGSAAGQGGELISTTTITTITTTIITTAASVTPEDLDERVRLFLERRQNAG